MRYSADEVAVFIVAFDESVPIMQSASNYPVLSEIKWFGAETFVSKTDILNDPISSELVNAVQFTAMITADVNNVVHEHVKSHFLEAHGEVPTQYIYSAYDAAWLVGPVHITVRIRRCGHRQDCIPRRSGQLRRS